MKNKLFLFLVVLFIFSSIGTVFGQAANPNLVRNGDFSRIAREWPNLPLDWNTTYRGGDGFSPIKSEDGRFIGWAENIYSFTLAQNITGLTNGRYNLAAEFSLNPDSVVGDITMNVYSGSTLLKSRSVRNELFAVPRDNDGRVRDIRYELTDIQVTGATVRIEFVGTNILKYIGIDNVVFTRVR